MFGLTSIGLVHTLISLLALVAGFAALSNPGAARWHHRLGRTYIVLTVLASVTSFGIMRQGRLNEGHVLAALILVLLGVALFLGRRTEGAGWAARGALIAFSLTLFLSMVPGTVETFTRLPLGAPLLSGPQDPALPKLLAVALLAVGTLTAWQWRRTRA